MEVIEEDVVQEAFGTDFKKRNQTAEAAMNPESPARSASSCESPTAYREQAKSS